MKHGFRVMDSDLHVIEMGEVYEHYLAVGPRTITSAIVSGASPTFVR